MCNFYLVSTTEGTCLVKADNYCQYANFDLIHFLKGSDSKKISSFSVYNLIGIKEISEEDANLWEAEEDKENLPANSYGTRKRHAT